MQGVTMTREDVVKKLAELLPPDAILVGHSLDSDLKALCITHPYCIDTSICYSVKGKFHVNMFPFWINTRDSALKDIDRSHVHKMH